MGHSLFLQQASFLSTLYLGYGLLFVGVQTCNLSVGMLKFVGMHETTATYWVQIYWFKTVLKQLIGYLTIRSFWRYSIH